MRSDKQHRQGSKMKRAWALVIVPLACCIPENLSAETVVLQEGVDGYKGCVSATIWGPKARKPKTISKDVVYIRGTDARPLIKFDFPEKLKRKKLALARLEVFAPSAKVRMIMETLASEIQQAWTPMATWTDADAGKPWEAPGGKIDTTTDYKRGRPKGALDSYAIWEFNGRWFPHKYKFMAVPKGGKWLDFNVTDAAKKWLADPASNHGIMLHTINIRDRRFPHKGVIDIPSPTSKDPKLRPRLTLEFEPLEKPYLVGMTHTLRKYCDKSTRYRYWGPFEESYTLRMARNDYEGFQVMVYPMKEDLKGVTFEPSDLVAEKGEGKIPKESIKYNAQEMMRLYPNPKVKDWYFHGKNFYMPDPLIWDKPQDLQVHMSTPFWFTVHTKLDTSPGTYKGTITVKATNAPERKLNLTVKVWNYKIPKIWNFETMGQMVWSYVHKYYGKVGPDLRRRYIDFLLDHRFSPTRQYINTLSPSLKEIPYCIERGMSTIYLSGNFTGDPARLKKVYDEVKKLDLIHKSLVYIGDETSKWDEMRKRSDAIRKVCPEVMIMIGGSYPRKELLGVIDIYDPQIDIPKKKGHTFAISAEDVQPLIKEAQARGEKFFWYVAAGPMLPCPNVQLEDPLIASRVLFWITWKFGVTGFEYYCYNIWKHNLPKGGKRWPDIPHQPHAFDRKITYNGDGNLFYPGPDGPFSSVRFENIRDGVEDWESHYVLRDHVEALEAKINKDPGLAEKTKAVLEKAKTILKVPDDVTKMDFVSWTWEPEPLIRAHRELGDTIQAMTAFVTEEEMLAVRKARHKMELDRQMKMLKERAEKAK